jgi:hypothetical protein
VLVVVVVRQAGHQQAHQAVLQAVLRELVLEQQQELVLRQAQ